MSLLTVNTPPNETSPFKILFSLTNRLLLKDTSFSTNKRLFIDTSSNIESFNTNMRLLSETSLFTKSVLFMDTSFMRIDSPKTVRSLFNDASLVTRNFPDKSNIFVPICKL